MNVKFNTNVRNSDYTPTLEGSIPFLTIEGVGKVTSWSPDFRYALVEFKDEFFSVPVGNIKKLTKKRNRKK